MTEQELAALNSRAAIEIMGWRKGRDSHYTSVNFEFTHYYYDQDGKQTISILDDDGDYYDFVPGWKPTTDHNHAAMVKEAMRGKGWGWGTSSIGNCTYCIFEKIVSDGIGCVLPEDYVDGSVTAESEPLAIVQAALLAIEALKGRGG